MYFSSKLLSVIPVKPWDVSRTSSASENIPKEAQHWSPPESHRSDYKSWLMAIMWHDAYCVTFPHVMTMSIHYKDQEALCSATVSNQSKHLRSNEDEERPPDRRSRFIISVQRQEKCWLSAEWQDCGVSITQTWTNNSHFIHV